MLNKILKITLANGATYIVNVTGWKEEINNSENDIAIKGDYRITHYSKPLGKCTREESDMVHTLGTFYLSEAVKLETLKRFK